MSILLPKQVDLNKIKFTGLKNAGFNKMVFMSYGRDKLRIQTPKMKCPYGLSIFQKQDDNGNKIGTPSYYIELSFNGMKNKRSLETYHTLLSELDDVIINMAVDKKWLRANKTIKYDVMKEMYSPQIRLQLDENGNPTDFPDSVKFKIPIDKFNKITTEFYNVEQKLVDYKYINKGCEIIAIVECNGVWIGDNTLGVSWKIVQAQVYPSDVGFDEKDDSGGDDDLDGFDAV